MADPKKPQKRGGKRDSARQPPHASATSRWEWAVAGLGLAIVLGIVGYLGYGALTSPPSVPSISIALVAVETTPGGHVVRFSAHNSGASTASSLRIVGELRHGEAVIEASEAILDYLPPASVRRGGLIFQNDPSRYELRLLPKGYVEP